MDEQIIESTFSELKRSSRASLSMVLIGVVFLLGSLFYAVTRLGPLEEEIKNKTVEIRQLRVVESDYKTRIENSEKKINSLLKQSKDLINQIEQTESKVQDLRKTESSILDFLVSVADKNKVHILDESVDWNEVKRQLSNLPYGDRKNALLNAILLAWKDIPFTMGGRNIRAGFDSPRFLQFVLETVNLNIETVRGQRLSDTMMQRFEKVNHPRVGDLVFFKGQVGSFGFILLSVGSRDEEHVGIGTLQRIAPLQIISMGNINTPYFPLRGYYQVIYPDEIGLTYKD
jgi:hypothetical protein